MPSCMRSGKRAFCWGSISPVAPTIATNCPTRLTKVSAVPSGGARHSRGSRGATAKVAQREPSILLGLTRDAAHLQNEHDSVHSPSRSELLIRCAVGPWVSVSDAKPRSPGGTRRFWKEEVRRQKDEVPSGTHFS